MIFEQVRDIISKQLEIDPKDITLSTSFVDDLNADSLDLVELIADFEDEFEVEVDESMLDKIKTVKDVVDYFESI